ncbi:venom protease-like isoform X2 [Oratosquilla oratoria]|uniref:venom protease-like isoform X2 n=1 Tax=Oratosquilla oratoria TaxID=337810 RepID=UPI003F76BB7B
MIMTMEMTWRTTVAVEGRAIARTQAVATILPRCMLLLFLCFLLPVSGHNSATKESRAAHPLPPPKLAALTPATSIPAPASIDFECGLRFGVARLQSEKVVGGMEAKPNSWPWMVIIGSLGHRGRITWFCGGVLVTPTTVLTAGHCTQASHVDVARMGEHDYLNPSEEVDTLQDRTVVDITIHPGYQPGRNLHDLALLLLSEPITHSLHVAPICLPWAENVVNIIGRQLVVTGWGATKYSGVMSPQLREVVVTVLKTRKCDEAYRVRPDYKAKFGDGIGEGFICAGDPKGSKDSCRGDSGGPLMYNRYGRYILAGIVTAGLGCGHAHYPGIYTDVVTHLQWICDTAF